MKLTDEQLKEALRDAGHTAAAEALEQSIAAGAGGAGGGEGTGGEGTGTAAGDGSKGTTPARDERPEPVGVDRIARGYAANAAAGEQGRSS